MKTGLESSNDQNLSISIGGIESGSFYYVFGIAFQIEKLGHEGVFYFYSRKSLLQSIFCGCSQLIMRVESAVLAFVAVLAVLMVVEAQKPTCRFSKSFSSNSLLNDLWAREKFIKHVAYYEGMFGKIGVNEKTGLTYDGMAIDYETGLPNESPHIWSAPSKESLHLMILAKALVANDYAAIFLTRNMNYSSDDVAEIVINVLEQKMDQYEKWNRDFPGFGGYIPWYANKDSGVEPMPDWTHSVPALDMGEMIWAIYACQIVTHQLSYTPSPLAARAGIIADRMQAYLDLLAKTAPIIFWDGPGLIRAVATIKDPQAQPNDPSNYGMNCDNTKTNCYLDDPYEGELMAVFMYLYSRTLSADDRSAIWIQKRAKTRMLEYRTKAGKSITVREGFFFSSHEEWALMQLPYLTASPTYRRVFLNGERARTTHSAENNIPGLYASVTDFCPPGKTPPSYVSAVGIQSIASQHIYRKDIVTPYGAYPVILADPGVGLVWYQHMLNYTAMQGPFGSTEAFATNGSMISPVLTWDSKITTFVAMLGGVSDIVETGLRRDLKFDEFASVIESEYAKGTFIIILQFTMLHTMLQVGKRRKKIADFLLPLFICIMRNKIMLIQSILTFLLLISQFLCPFSTVFPVLKGEDLPFGLPPPMPASINAPFTDFPGC